MVVKITVKIPSIRKIGNFLWGLLFSSSSGVNFATSPYTSKFSLVFEFKKLLGCSKLTLEVVGETAPFLREGGVPKLWWTSFQLLYVWDALPSCLMKIIDHNN